MRDDEPRPVWMSLLITHTVLCTHLGHENLSQKEDLFENIRKDSKMGCFHGGDEHTCVVSLDERTDNMLWGKLGDHSVGGGPTTKPIHTQRARAPTNKCVHGKPPSLCLKGYGGNSVCVHGSLTTVCLKGCGGNSVCVHGSLKSVCLKGFGGNSVCVHGSLKSV